MQVITKIDQLKYECFLWQGCTEFPEWFQEMVDKGKVFVADGLITTSHFNRIETGNYIFRGSFVDVFPVSPEKFALKYERSRTVAH